MIRIFVATLLGGFLLPACKSVPLCLQDLRIVDPRIEEKPLPERMQIFDAGQLAHEALVYLSQAQAMTLPEAMESLAKAAVFVDRSRCSNPLHRADAAVLLGRLAMRIPVLPIETPFEYKQNSLNMALDQIGRLEDAWTPLEAEALIKNLESPDVVVRQAARARLREVVGDVNHGDDVSAWDSWWESVQEEKVAEFREACREPVRVLGQLEFQSASEARSVLAYLVLRLRQHDDPILEKIVQPAALRVARQAVVFALLRSINDPDAQVRSDVAQAMGGMLDPSFGDALNRQLLKERDPWTASKIVRALGAYPGGDTVQGLIILLGFDHNQVQVNVRDVLVGMTGVDFGNDSRSWEQWWNTKGAKKWH